MAAGSKVSDYRLLPDGCHATTEQEYSQFWNETANSYDDFVAEHAPQMHKLIPQLLLSYQHKYNVEIPRDGSLLDVGSGTGIAAQAMIDIFGYQGIMDGIEGSEEMIRIARTKNLYREIFLEFIDERIISTLQEGFYDICIACATFGDRTIKAARIKDMLQFMKPNSYLAIVSASYALLEPYKGATLSTMQMIANWEKQGLLKLVHTQEFPQFWANLTGTGLLLQKSSV